jgi:hypothetical protein
MRLLLFIPTTAATLAQLCLWDKVQSIGRKQGMNTRNSNEAELVAADEVAGTMIWANLFLQTQGHSVSENVLCRDNRSAILLEKNGRKSARN